MRHREFIRQKEKEYIQDLWKNKSKGLIFMADYAGLDLEFLIHELRVFEIDVPNAMVIHARKLLKVGKPI